MLQLLELRDFSKTCKMKENRTEAAFPKAWPCPCVHQAKQNWNDCVIWKEHVLVCEHSIQAQYSQCTWLLSQGGSISVGIDFHIVTILSQSAYNFYIIRNYIKKLFLQWKIMLFQCNPIYFTIVLWNLLYPPYKE